MAMESTNYKLGDQVVFPKSNGVDCYAQVIKISDNFMDVSWMEYIKDHDKFKVVIKSTRVPSNAVKKVIKNFAIKDSVIIPRSNGSKSIAIIKEIKFGMANVEWIENGTNITKSVSLGLIEKLSANDNSNSSNAANNTSNAPNVSSSKDFNKDSNIDSNKGSNKNSKQGLQEETLPTLADILEDEKTFKKDYCFKLIDGYCPVMDLTASMCDQPSDSAKEEVKMMKKQMKDLKIDPVDIGYNEGMTDYSDMSSNKVEFIEYCTDYRTIEALYPGSVSSKRGIFHVSKSKWDHGASDLSSRMLVYAEKELAKSPVLQQLKNVEVDNKINIPQFNENPKSIDDLNNEANKMAMSLLHNYGSLVIGERHEDSAPKKLIMDNLDTIKNEGAVLALEHLLYEPYQRLLDQYSKSPQGAPLPALLDLYLKSMDNGFHIENNNFNFRSLVIAAKEKGVRMIAIDTVASYAAGSSITHGVTDSASRYKALSYTTKKILEKEISGTTNPKVVFLVGSGHVSKRLGVPGISEVMGGAPTLVIMNSDRNKIRKNVDEGDKGNKAHVVIEVGK